MIHTPSRNKKRIALLLSLGLVGFVCLLIGLLWDVVVHLYATDLARTENAFNLINPDHISIADAIVAGIVRLGHFLLVFGLATMLTGLIGAIYIHLRSTRNSGWAASSLRRGFIAGTGVLVVLAASAATWAIGAVSYEDKLASDPSRKAVSNGSSGGKEHHQHACHQPPTPQQQEAADELAAATKANLAKYADHSVAKADGYRPISPTWRPTMHYLNPAHQRDGEILDPGRPEALVYANTSDGTILLGAMYLMPEPGVSGPRIGGCLTQWHPHSLLGWKTPEMMHVWTATNVPGGPFSELRPREFISSLES